MHFVGTGKEKMHRYHQTLFIYLTYQESTATFRDSRGNDLFVVEYAGTFVFPGWKGQLDAFSKLQL